MPSWTVMKMP